MLIIINKIKKKIKLYIKNIYLFIHIVYNNIKEKYNCLILILYQIFILVI